MASPTSLESSKNAMGMGSGLGGALLKPELCCNNASGFCHNKADKYCTNCHLVQYCGVACQKAHWPRHKVDCRSPLGKYTWRPDYVLKGHPARQLIGDKTLDAGIGNKKYYWGNTPAYDVLNMASNEGSEYDKNLELLFAASGDLRCIMKTVVQIPATYNQKINIVVNDTESDIVLRNAVMLLLALQFPDGEINELIVHLWYSAALPANMYMCGISDKVVPLIRAVCENNAQAANHTLVSNEWVFGQSSLRLALEKFQWTRLLDILELKHTPSISVANEKRRAAMIDQLSDAQRHVLDSSWLAVNPYHRICDKRWRESGLLLPFAHDGTGFDTPNPFFFGPSKQWLVDWSPRNMPISSSDIVVHGYKGPRVPANDINGMLFFERKSMVEGFCKAIQTFKATFSMYQIDAMDIGSTLAKANWHRPGLRFDRIDTSNIADDGYLHLPATLSACGPLLKKQNENPRATLLTYFMMVRQDVITHEAAFGYTTDITIKFPSTYDPDEFVMCLLTPEQNKWAPKDNVWGSHVINMLRNKEEMFERYRNIYRFTDSAIRTGVKERFEHKIVDQFPHQINLLQNIEEWSSNDLEEPGLLDEQSGPIPMPGLPGFQMMSGLPRMPQTQGSGIPFFTIMDAEGRRNMEKMMAKMKFGN